MGEQEQYLLDADGEMYFRNGLLYVSGQRIQVNRLAHSTSHDGFVGADGSFDFPLFAGQDECWRGAEAR